MTDDELFDMMMENLHRERNRHFERTGTEPKAVVLPQTFKDRALALAESRHGKGDGSGLTVMHGVQVFGDREVVVLDYDGWELKRVPTSGVA